MSGFITPKGVGSLVQADARTRKSHLLLAASELYVANGQPTQVEQHVYAELFRQYIADTPVMERRQISTLLARCPFAPHDCVLALSQDPDASVAHRVLAFSPVLTTCDLVAAIGRGPHAIRRAISLRHEIPEEVRAALRRHAEPRDADALAEDDVAQAAPAPQARPERQAASVQDTPQPEEAAAQPDRSAAPPDGARAFLDADSRGRAVAIATAQARVLAEAAAAGYRSRPKVDPVLVRCLEQAALAGDAETVRRLLHDTLALSPATVERIVADPHGEALIVCCAALGLPTSRTVSLMLRLSPAVYSLERLRDLSALRANLDARVARRMVAEWSGRAPRHQPVLEDALRTRRDTQVGQADRTERDDRNVVDSAGVLVLRDAV